MNVAFVSYSIEIVTPSRDSMKLPVAAFNETTAVKRVHEYVAGCHDRPDRERPTSVFLAWERSDGVSGFLNPPTGNDSDTPVSWIAEAR